MYFLTPDALCTNEFEDSLSPHGWDPWFARRLSEAGGVHTALWDDCVSDRYLSGNLTLRALTILEWTHWAIRSDVDLVGVHLTLPRVCAV